VKQVIVFPRGQLTKADKAAISKAGCVAVEADDPSRVVTVLPMASPVSADDMMLSLLEAVAGNVSEFGGKTAEARFVKGLVARTNARGGKS